MGLGLLAGGSASQFSSRLPQRDHHESLMHYSGTKFCAWVMPSWACIRRADPFLCPPSPSFVHISIVQGLSYLCLSCALFSIVISCLFHFFQIPLRSVHPCHSVERISHTPLDTSATLTLCATHRPKTFRRRQTTYYLVDSDQEQHSQPSVVHSLPRSITRSISFNLLYTVPLLKEGNT